MNFQVRDAAPLSTGRRLHGTGRERRPGQKYRVRRSGDGTNGATNFPDGSERGPHGMKRLRAAVNAIKPPEWAAHIARIRTSVLPAELRKMEKKVSAMRRIERCSEMFAFGLIIRHVAGNRYDDGTNIVSRLVDEIVAAKKFTDIVF